MKLTLTREQIPLARDAMRALRVEAVRTDLPEVQGGARKLPGHDEWAHRSASKEIDLRWADALEAAIAEAEDKDAEGPQPGPVSDADERAFWREAFTLDYAQPSNWYGADRARYSVQAADVALAGYRAAFCTGMPSDQKGAK